MSIAGRTEPPFPSLLTTRPLDVFIFAAGRGTRLRPVTDGLPKPLLDIHGLGLIEIHLHRLAAAGFSRAIINLHHLGEMIRTRLGDGCRYGIDIRYSFEPDQALETAGGIVNGLHLVESERFAVVSADVLCDFPMQQLREPAAANIDGCLVMVDNPAHHPRGDFLLDQQGLLQLRSAGSVLPARTFAGIGWFRRSVFESLLPGKRPLRPILETAIAASRLRGVHHGGIWSDIGTLERLEQARQSPEIGAYISSVKASSS